MTSSTDITSSKPASLALRYGADSVPAAGPWNAHLDLLLSHRSVRGYWPDPLPEGTLETLIAAAQSAATSSNLQTWSVIAVTDAGSKAQLAAAANNQKHIEQCPLFLVWLADLSRNERLATEEGAGLETIPYLETFLVAAIDAALAAQNAVVAAESLGLSTVYIGALRNDPMKVREVLGLPDRTFGVFGLCVGHAAADAVSEIKPRLPQPGILFRERYGNADEASLRSGYDAKMTEFSRRNEMADDSWSARVIKRMGAIPAMSGRHRLKDVLRAMGFALR